MPEISPLSPADFGAYFEAIHHLPPFPWQARLLTQVARAGRWPTSLDLPTGSGKTAAIDVALFHLALDAALPPNERKAPRRIVMVVDRRTVVDQAFERAKTIATALSKAEGGVVGVVAARLSSLSGTGWPLALAQLRGGMPRDDAWAKRPDQPLVAVSTVDQVGSRLLFRGYGVSEVMRPIHAGLLGNDTLLLLDEVHLSEPFRQTLEALRRYRGWAGPGLPDRWQFVVMSATPGAPGEFGLEDSDRRDQVLLKRLGASKPAEIPPAVKVSGSEPARRAIFAAACAARVAPFATPGRAVAVIVNRVATARLAFDAIRKRLGCAADVFLVTGRMRPLDRDDLDEKLGRLVRSGRTRDPGAAPVVVVATQCIEAGADFDFDAIVTECASLDALRQRFGRLNRLGAIDDARGVVLVRSDAVGSDADDPVYGPALAATWTWLGEAPRDFGIDAIAPALPLGEDLARLVAAKPDAPVMLPAHLDAWVQTMPSPQPDPDVSLWLHGVGQKQAPEVQVVWRADLTEAMLASARGNSQVLEELLERVEACPPVGLEAISLPIYAVRAWLEGDAAPDLVDVEGRALDEELEGEDAHGRDREPRAARPALLWKGDESDVIDSGALRPGSTLVVPSTYGGLADSNWAPASDAEVSDLGDRARWQQTRRPTLRLHPAVVAGALSALPSPPDPEDADNDDRGIIKEWLDAATASDPIRAAMLEAFGRRPAIVRIDAFAPHHEHGEKGLGNGYYVLVGRFRVPEARADLATKGDVTTEDDRASLTGVEVTLDEHLRGVATLAQEFAQGCGLPSTVARDLVLAGRWHDAGKVDRRFQRMLHGGSEARAAVEPEPLAKSAIVAADRAAHDRAAKGSGYPRGARHELSSVALLVNSALLAEAADRDLVLHLVASHHGRCRPFAPVVPDPEPVELELASDGGPGVVSSDHGLARLDSGIADRFWRLVEGYGWFGLAWLEAMLRLADHRRSEQEQEQGPGAKEAV